MVRYFDYHNIFSRKMLLSKLNFDLTATQPLYTTDVRTFFAPVSALIFSPEH
jgi:hypothetical protein